MCVYIFNGVSVGSKLQKSQDFEMMKLQVSVLSVFLLCVAIYQSPLAVFFRWYLTHKLVFSPQAR